LQFCNQRFKLNLTALGEMQMAGRLMKDVGMLGGHQEITFDCVANDPGMTLFHCVCG
jgi:hypothetical protein